MTDVEISDVTSLNGLFTEVNSNNPNIDTINISGWNTSHITDMGEMFANCGNIKRIIGIEDLDLKSCRYMYSMFSMCTSLESLDISKWKPNVQILSDISGMFDTCSSLTEIKGIESEIWEEVIANIPSSGVEKMFIKCPKLKLDLRSWYDFKDTTEIVKKCPKIKL
jgi:surface protein